jgi:hypothetical protein
MADAVALLDKYRSKGVLLDSNLLVLMDDLDLQIPSRYAVATR